MADWNELKRLAEATESTDASDWHIVDDLAMLMTSADAAFVVAANPAVILALIAEVERLEAACRQFAQQVEFARRQKEGLLAERDQLRAEVEALRKDAERFRFIEQDADSGMSKIYGDEWVAVIDESIAAYAAMGKGEQE